MAPKAGKKKSNRPDKYQEKVHLNTSFTEAIQLLADAVNKKVKERISAKK